MEDSEEEEARRVERSQEESNIRQERIATESRHTLGERTTYHEERPPSEH